MKWVLLAFLAGLAVGCWLGHRAGKTAAYVEMYDRVRAEQMRR